MKQYDEFIRVCKMAKPENDPMFVNRKGSVLTFLDRDWYAMKDEQRQHFKKHCIHLVGTERSNLMPDLTEITKKVEMSKKFDLFMQRSVHSKSTITSFMNSIS